MLWQPTHIHVEIYSHCNHLVQIQFLAFNTYHFSGMYHLNIQHLSF